MKIKQRQQPHHASRFDPEPGRARHGRRDGDRRDSRRRPVKYFVAKRLLETDMTPERLDAARTAARPVKKPRPTPLGRVVTRVGDVMIADVVTIPATASVLDAARAMRDANVGMLPVVERSGRLRGVVTDRDLVIRVLAEGAAARRVAVSDHLTVRVLTARPDWSADQAMETMANAKVGRLPVVDGRGRVLGVVTLSSLVMRGRDRDEALDTAEAVARRAARRPRTSPAA
jgi:CBS domain-containing protein